MTGVGFRFNVALTARRAKSVFNATKQKNKLFAFCKLQRISQLASSILKIKRVEIKLANKSMKWSKG